MSKSPTDPRNDPEKLRVPFVFVRRGERPPREWIAEHPDHLRVPAVMVPRGAPPPGPWGGSGSAPTQPQEPQAEAAPEGSLLAVAGGFAPPSADRRCTVDGRPWPTDSRGRDWPADRWGRPMRPLWDYPSGVRAPGEAGASGQPGSVNVREPVAAYRLAEARMADPANIGRAVLGQEGAAEVQPGGQSAARTTTRRSERGRCR